MSPWTFEPNAFVVPAFPRWEIGVSICGGGPIDERGRRLRSHRRDVRHDLTGVWEAEIELLVAAPPKGSSLQVEMKVSEDLV